MNDNLAPDRPEPRRRRARLALAGAVVLCLIVGGTIGGYYFGRSSPPETSSECVEARQEVRDMKDEVDSADAATAANLSRTQLNMVVQGGDCFTGRERGQAQTVLDRLDEQAAAKAECDASDEPWWECGP
ncbi:hypothetical protein ACGFZC_00830 [[Kitasatospora] papulosa]|uniref:hypothetical protein n=1 Tax=[Kitasatospora] papulosa TaxID=1464011 RepID=UPI00371E1FEA